jgi:hypothetical protein
MNYTRAQLEKIDLSKLKLEPLDSTVPLFVANYQNWVSIRSAETTVTIIRRDVDSDWTTHDGARCMSKRQLDAMFARAEKVDAFIVAEITASEQRELREKHKPACGDGWEFCDKENATEACVFSNMGNRWFRWETVSSYAFNCNSECYLFRRPISNPEPKLPSVKAPEGWSWGVPNYNRSRVQIQKDNQNVAWFIPEDGNTRDAMAACVAAYDEANRSGRRELLASLANISSCCKEDRYGRPTDMSDFRITVSGVCKTSELSEFLNPAMVSLSVKPS